MRWWLKAGIQKGISILPWGRSIHHFLQQKLWRSLRLSDDFLIDRLSHVEKHLNAWKHFHPSSNPRAILELGTGWYPIVPIGMYLSGVDQIYSVDQNQYLSSSRFAELLSYLKAWHAEGLLERYLPSLQPERWKKLWQLHLRHQDDFDQLLSALPIHYWVGDGRALPYPQAHFDLIHSNNTFEHIPPKILVGLIQEMQRVLSPKGVMSHYIDLADHYSYGDSTLSPLHFLRFSERQWSWIENRFQSQNRLRINQYEALYEAQGLTTISAEVEYAAENALAGFKLAAPFATFPLDKVRVLYAQLISRK